MHRDGDYAVWFRTMHGEGTGVVHLVDGKISGGDCMFAYGGRYDFDGDNFTATLTTRRHSAGPTTVFGCDEVEALLTGQFKGTTAVCVGAAKQAPDIRFEATLFLQQEPLPAPDPARAPLPAKAAKLPKIPTSRLHAGKVVVTKRM